MGEEVPDARHSDGVHRLRHRLRRRRRRGRERELPVSLSLPPTTTPEKTMETSGMRCSFFSLLLRVLLLLLLGCAFLGERAAALCVWWSHSFFAFLCEPRGHGAQLPVATKQREERQRCCM